MLCKQLLCSGLVKGTVASFESDVFLMSFFKLILAELLPCDIVALTQN